MTSAPPRAPAFSLCVYCGSRPGHDPRFAQAAAQVGHWIGARGGQLVYGGGRGGLMGVAADAALAAGGRVLGIIPRDLVEREHAHRGCTELVIVDTMHERKRLMAERSHAFLALPGGIGTFEEFFEAWTWRQLGYLNQPIGLLNLHGYYDALLAFIAHGIAAGFMDPSYLRLIEVGSECQPLLQHLVSAAGWPAPQRTDAI
ncbi:MAG: TIGR00730 family Rossman fold protein [Burkholderiaceae bacterium]|nr:TIGR00730 family Rossman fold protein [Burkholderiaceae bacterium]